MRTDFSRELDHVNHPGRARTGAGGSRGECSVPPLQSKNRSQGRTIHYVQGPQCLVPGNQPGPSVAFTGCHGSRCGGQAASGGSLNTLSPAPSHRKGPSTRASFLFVFLAPEKRFITVSSSVGKRTPLLVLCFKGRGVNFSQSKRVWERHFHNTRCKDTSSRSPGSLFSALLALWHLAQGLAECLHSMNECWPCSASPWATLCFRAQPTFLCPRLGRAEVCVVPHR